MRIAPLSALAAALLATAAAAKLPPPSDEAKAAAAAAAAKAAWSGKVANYQLCKAQDKAAANHQVTLRQIGRAAKLAADTPACADPGPFVAAAPVPPLEAAGAHSPAATAVAPPSSKATQEEISGVKKK